MALDQQALVEMFRQGFSPLADLSAGQLQLAIGQQQRDYAARQQQQQRAQAMQDHLTGLREQARLQQANQLAVEGARFSNDRTITADRTASGLAQADMERYWRTLDKGDETLTDLRRIAAAQGLDTTEFKDAVSLTSGLAKHVKAKTERLTGEATDLYLSLYDAEQALTDANAKTQLTEAERVKIVLPYALAAAGKDAKLKASLSKMTSADDIATELSLKVEAADGTIKRMGDALAVKENSLRSTHASAIRSASVAADRINRQILDLPPGTTPDRAVLKKRGVSLPKTTAAVADAGLLEADIDSALVPASVGGTAQAAPAPASVATPKFSEGWGFLSDALNLGAAVPTMGGDIGVAVRRGAGNAVRGAVGTKGMALLRNATPGSPFVSMRPQVPIINIPRDQVPTIDISGPGIRRPQVPIINTSSFMPGSLTGLQSAQHAESNPLAHINALIQRAQDPSVSGALRALRAGAAPDNMAEVLREIFEAGGIPTEEAVPAWQY